MPLSPVLHQAWEAASIEGMSTLQESLDEPLEGTCGWIYHLGWSTC